MKFAYIFGLVFLLCLVGVSAYDFNESLIINSEYRVDGILTTSTAKISIFSPLGNPLVEDAAMTGNGTGKFLYNYTIPYNAGEYRALVKFFSGNKLLATQEKTFNVGNVNAIEFGVCPTSTTGTTLLVVMLILSIVLGIVGIMYKNAGLSLFAGVLLIFLATATWGCGTILGIFTIIGGVIFLIFAGTYS